VRAWSGALDEQAAALPDVEHVVHPDTTHLAALLAHWHDVLSALRVFLD
jgi:hypothetical protein